MSHSISEFFTVHKLKPSLLCIVMLLACKPNLVAQSQTSDPYETNCVVTLGPTGCGAYGGEPCWIKYDQTVKDNTPGAAIDYYVWEGPAPYTNGQVIPGSSGAHIIITIYASDEYFQDGLNGYMTATAPGYSTSNQVSLSF